jgi:hypothetical protein
MEVLAVVVPEIPVMVTVNGPPAGAVVLALSVSTLVEVVGLVAKAAVTPVGSPVAARVTVPLKLLNWLTVMVLVALLPCGIEALVDELESVKPGAAVTLMAMVVVAVSAPEVPVIVTLNGPAIAAVLLAVKVSTLELAAGLVAKAAVTPAGRPVTVRVTLPVKAPKSATVMVSVVLVVGGMTTEVDAGVSVNPEPVPDTTKDPEFVDWSFAVKATLSAPAVVGVKLTVVENEALPLKVLEQEVDGVTVAEALLPGVAVKVTDGDGVLLQVVSLRIVVMGEVVVEGVVAVPVGEVGTVTALVVTCATVSPPEPVAVE